MLKRSTKIVVKHHNPSDQTAASAHQLPGSASRIGTSGFYQNIWKTEDPMEGSDGTLGAAVGILFISRAQFVGLVQKFVAVYWHR